MTLRDHAKAWTNHAALNLGVALCALWHTVLPPQVDHSKETVESLSRSTPLKEFLSGLRS